MNKRSWAWRICALLAVLVFALGVAACGDDDDDEGDSGTGAAAATAPANLTLGYVTTAQHPYGVAVDQYVKLVSDMSGGAMVIKTVPSYTGGDVPLLQAVRAGAPEMATVSTTVWDSAGPTNAFQALQAGPLFINNYDFERAILVDEDGGQSDIANDMLDQMESDLDNSLVGLAIHEGGLRSPLGKQPLVSPADWQGKKIRATESGGMAEGLKSLGAEPVGVPLPDVYDALRRGTVDGMEANTGLIATQGFYEQAKNFTGNVVLWPFPTALVMNTAAWDALDEDQQQVLTDAADQLPAFILDTLTGGTGDPFAQALANCGVKFLQASDADVAALATAGEAATESLAASDENVSAFIDRIKEVKEGVESTATPTTTAEAEPGATCELTGQPS
jgi:TRAP-type transport system periplasmic protein